MIRLIVDIASISGILVLHIIAVYSIIKVNALPSMRG